MKERIVIENSVDVSIMKRHPNWEYSQFLIPDKQYKREQVPETWEELKELCKDLKDVDIEEADEIDVARIIIHNADLIYFEDEILMIAGFKKLEIKPEQMWQIIKGLIGA